MAGELQATGGPVSVQLTADAKPFEQGMDRATRAVQQASQKIEGRFSQLSKRVDDSTRKVGQHVSRLGTVIGGGGALGQIGAAFSGGLVGGLVALGAVSFKAFSDMVTGADKARAAIEANAKSTERLVTNFQRLAGIADKQITGDTNLDTRLQKIDRELESWEDTLSVAQSVRQEQQRLLTGFTESRFDRRAAFVLGQFEDRKKALESFVAESDAAVNAARQRVNQLRDQRFQVEEERLKQLNDRNLELARQFREEEARKQEAIEATAKSREDQFAKTIAGLERERFIIGRTAEEIAAYDARLAGLSEAQVKRIQQEVAALELRRNAFLENAQAQQLAARTAGSALVGGSQAAVNAIAAARNAGTGGPTQSNNVLLPVLNNILRETQRQVWLQERQQQILRDLRGDFHENEWSGGADF